MLEARYGSSSKVLEDDVVVSNTPQVTSKTPKYRCIDSQWEDC